MTSIYTSRGWIEHVLTGCQPPLGFLLTPDNNEARIGLWLMFARNIGMVGMSSRALAKQVLGMEPGVPEELIDYPRDPSDLNRCAFLIESVPDAREAVDELARMSPYWEALALEWDVLVGQLQAEKAVDDGHAPATYASMQTLIGEVDRRLAAEVAAAAELELAADVGGEG